MKKKIMILGASILQLPAIKKANEMGLQVIAVDMNPNAVGFKEKNVISEVISTIDIESVLNAAKKHKIDGIMTLASDMPMRTVAVVAKEMNLIGISKETALKATNKIEMRNALGKYNVPIPLYFQVTNKREYLYAVKKVREKGYKCIVKPADNSGSRGIKLLNNYDKNTVEEAYNYSKKYSRSGDLIVEEYMEGPEVSVETISLHGKCYVIQITDKLTTGSPYFVEMGHSQPSQVGKIIEEKITKVASDANKAIGIKNGPSHTEIKLTKDGPKVVELGARLGGDNITTHLVPLSTGIDMVEACIRISLGEKPNLERKYEKASAIRYLKQHKGKISSVKGIEQAKKIDGIKQVNMVYEIGEEVNEIKNSSDRIGFVISQANNVKEAIMKCEEALNKIEIVLD